MAKFRHQKPGSSKNTGHQKPGIFCLETATWEDIAEDQDSYDHFLRFLETSSSGGIEIPYRHYDVATKEELLFYLDKWKGPDTDIQERYPFLYLAFHGHKTITMPDGEKATAGQLVDILYDDSPDHAIIHFSSCYLADDRMKKLLYNTSALSVSGYENEKGGDWYTTVAFELLYLTELFRFGLPKTSREMRDFVDSYFAAHEEMKFLAESLRFRMFYRVDKADLSTGKHPLYINACTDEELEAEYGPS